jgi:hypothetical protein
MEKDYDADSSNHSDGTTPLGVTPTEDSALEDSLVYSKGKARAAENTSQAGSCYDGKKEQVYVDPRSRSWKYPGKTSCSTYRYSTSDAVGKDLWYSMTTLSVPKEYRRYSSCARVDVLFGIPMVSVVLSLLVFGVTSSRKETSGLIHILSRNHPTCDSDAT